MAKNLMIKNHKTKKAYTSRYLRKTGYDFLIADQVIPLIYRKINN